MFKREIGLSVGFFGVGFSFPREGRGKRYGARLPSNEYVLVGLAG